MNSKKYQLEIILKSDLCTGSGYSFAGIVDSDVCYDSCGLPYIPSRRLKGCLRTAAETVLLPFENSAAKDHEQQGKLDQLFGEAGQDKVTGIIIDNAYPDRYREMYDELSKLPDDYREYVTPQNVLGRYTTVKAQTRIGENGVAADNSLRFTRTVNHYAPKFQKTEEDREMRFTAAVSIENCDEEKDRLLHDAVRALRNIGLNRNRGLGSVHCRLIPMPDANISSSRTDIDNDEEMYVLRYRVRNLSPLMLSANDDSRTERYISGRSVLGFFAGAYLRSGKNADTEDFARLFLMDQVVFGALYPADTYVYYPAPFYIGRLKKTKRYVNISNFPSDGEWAEKNTQNGNQPKKLKGVFVALDEQGIAVKEPETDMVYHHSKKSRKQRAKNGQLLYTAEVLREQQIFEGEILGRGRDLKILISLMEEENFRFGKSRSAQYGLCVLEGKPEVEILKKADKVYPAGSRIMAVFQSDAVFMSNVGYTVRYRDVRDQIRAGLGIVEQDPKKEYAEIEAGELTGYYSKWNLKRETVPVVKAGSCMSFTLAEDLRTDRDVYYIGEYTGEGFGRMLLIQDDMKKIPIAEIKVQNEEKRLPSVSAALCGSILLEEARESLMQSAAGSDLHFSNPAALGRVTLMLTESMQAYPHDAAERYKDYFARLDSIKQKDKTGQAKKMLEKLICKDEYLSPENLEYLKAGGPGVERLKILEKLYDQLPGIEGSFTERMADLWSDYLMAALVQEKYNLKKRGDRS